MSRRAILTLRGPGVRGGSRPGPLPGQAHFEGRIAYSADDAYQRKASGVTDTTDEVLRLGTDQLETRLLTGVRWRGVSLNHGESITEARIQFRTWSSGNTHDVHLRIHGEAADNAAAFTTTDFSLTTRTTTAAFVDWIVPSWPSGTSGEHTTTPDLSAIVQEIVNRAGWAPGNALVFLIELAPSDPWSDFPRRRAWAFDGSSADAAYLSVNEAEAPSPPPPGPDPDPPTLAMRGDPAFDANNLNDTTLDAWGITQRGWHTRLLAAVNDSTRRANRDSAFDRDNWRTWNRTGSSWVVAMLSGLRATGDLRLLDECVRLMELAWAHQTVQTEAPAAGYLGWTLNRTVQDRILGWGVISQIMWACKHNADLVSPAGHNYGSVGQKYHGWLINHAFPSGNDPNNPSLPINRKGQQHCYAQMIRAMHYVALAGGGFGFSPSEYRAACQEMFDEKLATDVTGAVGVGGRTNRVWTHNVNVTSSTGTQGRSIQGSTYTRLEVPPLVDCYLEGAVTGLDLGYLQSWAAILSDQVADGDPENTGRPWGQTMAGDQKAEGFLGLPYYWDYYGRTDVRNTGGGWVHLFGFDTLAHLNAYAVSVRPALNDALPDVDTNVNWPGARLLDSVLFV